ncbi:hypothetical protein GCM10023149_20920 [Mucilaginibacter gynuensis]|uniref:Uncharacterized protein n=1 Tax=Mucilaginibacter gynuensis TaxID=1302236 RepID=A0ABP8GBD7_9SPHI
MYPDSSAELPNTSSLLDFNNATTLPIVMIDTKQPMIMRTIAIALRMIMV